MPHEFEDHTEVTVGATPEQVWEAIATGPGIDSWYLGHSKVEPHLGGTVRTDLGGVVLQSTVTAWEPHKRFGYRMPRGEDRSFLALEWHIEGRGGGSTVVRCVASGFIGSDDWEAEYDSLKAGVAFYFHNLAQCLTYFPGRTATPITAAQPRTGALEHSWTVLQGGLGLTGTVSDGEQVRLTPHGLPPIEGAVDYATPEFLGVRTSDGLYRFFPGTGGPRASMVVVEHHIFSDVDQVETERAWQSWLAELFA